MRMTKFLTALTFIILILGVSAASAEDHVTDYEVDGVNLFISGSLTSDTPGDFDKIIGRNPQVTRLVLGVILGSDDDEAMFPLYRRVREMGLETYLLADSEVYSGGADLFIAGATRRMERGAIIGVHSWSDGTNDAADFPRSADEHELNRGYVEAMLGTDEWYWFTIYSAPANGMHDMTETEINKFGLLTSPIITE